MGEAPILDYYKPHPPRSGWRGGLFFAFAFGTVIGSVIVGVAIVTIEMLFSLGWLDLCSALNGITFVGLILGIFGGVVLVIAMEIRVRFLNGQFEPRPSGTAVWAGALYPVPLTLFHIALIMADSQLRAYPLGIVIALGMAYPIGVAWVLIRPWGESVAAAELPAPGPVVEMDPPPRADHADPRNP